MEDQKKLLGATWPDRLRAAMEFEGFTVDADFARFLGVSPQTLSNWLQGKVNRPPSLLLQKLGDLLPPYGPLWMVNGIGAWPRPGTPYLQREAQKQAGDTGLSQGLTVHHRDDASQHPMALALRDTVSLTLLTDVKASAGRLDQGTVVYDEGQRISVHVPRFFLRQLLGFDPPVELGIMRADGDSMRPVFEDGDMLLYVPRRDLDGDGNYIVLVGGEVYAKRYQRIPGGGVKVISANKSDGYQDWHLVPNPDADEDMPLINQLTNRPVTFVVAGKIVWPQRDTGRVHVERVADIIRTILREGPSQSY